MPSNHHATAPNRPLSLNHWILTTSPTTTRRRTRQNQLTAPCSQLCLLWMGQRTLPSTHTPIAELASYPIQGRMGPSAVTDLGLVTNPQDPSTDRTLPGAPTQCFVPSELLHLQGIHNLLSHPLRSVQESTRHSLRKHFHSLTGPSKL